MKITLPIAGLLVGVWLLPVTGFTADTSTSAVPPSAKEAGGDMMPNRKAETGKPMRRSDHPIDDSVITTKVKGKFLKDKQIRGDNIEIKTVNGVVELGGVAKNRANSKRAATLARQVAGVKSVKNDIEIAPRNTAAAGDRSTDKPVRTADGRRSDQPVKDSWITTKVKAKLSENKINPAKVHVKTIDGVVELSGYAGNADQVSKAASLAGEIKGVKSVTNHIEVK
jgi:osmotically-inducible protein OsmY